MKNLFWKKVETSNHNHASLQRYLEQSFIKSTRYSIFFTFHLILHFEFYMRFYDFNNKFLFLAKIGDPPQIEEGVSLDFLIDRNKYIYFGGIKPKEVSKETKLSKFFRNYKIFMFCSQCFSVAVSLSTENLTKIVYFS